MESPSLFLYQKTGAIKATNGLTQKVLELHGLLLLLLVLLEQVQAAGHRLAAAGARARIVAALELSWGEGTVWN